MLLIVFSLSGIAAPSTTGLPVEFSPVEHHPSDFKVETTMPEEKHILHRYDKGVQM